MPTRSRLLIALTAVLLAMSLALPTWRIRLIAPQYPEGLGMQIRFHSVEGEEEHDLDNINELNHYIGMKKIDPAAMSELHYMPWVVGVLAVTGLIVAFAGRRRLLYTWAAGLGVAGAAGLYDFWRWTYDYGHHLDTEHAIIKVPGMVYQPPLIGTKQILNFTAVSWPASGGVLVGVAAVLVAAAVWLTLRGSTAGPRGREAPLVHAPAHGHAGAA